MTSPIINRIVFNQTPVYDAIKQLADLTDYQFYVDENKVLHFEPKGTTDSGETFGSGNVLQANFKERRDSVFNQVWVYGDKSLSAFKETFTAGSPVGGSIFNLLYKPSNTEITVSGAIIQPGGIYQMTYDPGSEVKYLVNYEDKQVIFTSGNIPSSGNAVIINYQRGLPIVKVGDNYASQSAYGKRVKVIVDKDIKDPQTAEDLMNSELEINSDPIKEGNLQVKGVMNLTPGQTANVNIPYHNVDNQTYNIIQADYQFSPENNLDNNVLNVKVNKKTTDLTDTMKQIILDLKKLKAGDIDTTDTITRYQTTTGSLSIRQSGLVVYTRSVIGGGLIFDSPTYGLLDTAEYGGRSTFILGAGLLGTTDLGDARAPWVVYYSGGYF